MCKTLQQIPAVTAQAALILKGPFGIKSYSHLVKILTVKFNIFNIKL